MTLCAVGCIPQVKLLTPCYPQGSVGVTILSANLVWMLVHCVLKYNSNFLSPVACFTKLVDTTTGPCMARPFFFGLVKIRMNQILCTYDISNQKTHE